MLRTIIFQKNISFMRWILKRRRLIAIAILLCVGFLIYQLSSLRELNVQMSKTYSKLEPKQDVSMPSAIEVNDHIIRPIVNDNTLNHDLDNRQLISQNRNRVNEDKNLDNKNEQKLASNKDFVMIGVLPKFYSLYEKKSTSFKCLLSGEEIPYSYLNDDYCDCVDGSDEPSTNACPQNKFFCTTSSGNSENFVPSDRVNDGICDCCDGSDEVKGVLTPIILTSSQLETMKSSRRQLVFSPPCPNRC